MTDTIFFRLLDGVNRPSRLSEAVEGLREGGEIDDVHSVNASSFRRIPNSPFAYWVSEEVRSKFTKLTLLEDRDRTAKQGLTTAGDFRFLRAWWEVPAQRTAKSREDTWRGKAWVPLAKGGEYSPYYADVHLSVNWREDGNDIKEHICSSYPYLNGNWEWVAKNPDFYFRPGLTWSRRTQRGLSIRAHPEGCIFGDKGPAVFASFSSLASMLALSNSLAFHGLVEVQMAFGSYEVGVLQRTPVPDLPASEAALLGDLALRCVELKRNIDSADEISHVFHLPAFLQARSGSPRERLKFWQELVYESQQQLVKHQREIDDVTFRLYSIEGPDRHAIAESLGGEDAAAGLGKDDAVAETEGTTEVTAILDPGTLAADLLSYAVGCAFGRWDARIALDPSLAPKLANPFAPLPICLPGMLIGPDELPAQRDGIASEEWMRARPDAITPPPDDSVQSPIVPDAEYLLAVDWDGIVVDNPEHNDDILRRVRKVLDLLWGERADDVEGETCDLLGVKDLRTYFRNPRQFFDHHIKRYSKSRRKAPIYWLLQSPKRNYGLWLYYHRLDSDILFKALKNYVEPKVRLEESRLEEYEASRRSAGTAGREARQAERALEKQEELLADLREFHYRLDRAARLRLRPDLNDGVVLNIAPLHELVPWKEAKSKWNDLLSGKYEWSSIGKQLREKGIV